MNLTFAVIVIFINVLVSLFLAWKIRSFRSTPGTNPLIILLLSVAIWSFGLVIEILTPTLIGKMIWVKIQYIGILAIAPTWCNFAIFYSLPFYSFSKDRWKWSFLYIIPLLSLLILWTNDWHGWFYQSSRLAIYNGIPLLVNQYGIWFWVSAIYAYAVIFVGSLVFIIYQLKNLKQFQRQALLILVAIVLPWIANIVHVSRLLPGIDLSLFAFNLSGILFFWALYRYQFLQFMPIAYHEVMDSSLNGVIILDNKKKIVTLNNAAQKLITPGDASQKIIGVDFFFASPSLANCLEPELFSTHSKKECALFLEDNEVLVEVNISPLELENSFLMGWMLSIKDITDQKRMERNLIQLSTELELRVVERTRDLQQLAEQRKRLFEVSLQMISTFSLEQVIRYVMNTLQEVLEFSVCIIYWLDAEKNVLRATEIISNDSHSLELVPEEIPIGKGIAGHAAKNRKAILANYAGQDPRSYYKNDIDQPANEHLVSVPLFYQDNVIGVFQVSRLYNTLFTQDEFELVQLFAAQANAAIQNARLFSELEEFTRSIQSQREQLRILASRVEQAREMEQLQLAQELHDRIGQNLTALVFNLNILEQLLPAGSSPAIFDRLKDSKAIIGESVNLVRNLLAGLRPPMLDDQGVFSAIKWYADNFSKRTNISVNLIGREIRPRLDLEIETALFRISQEALTNIAKHARARHVNIEIVKNDQYIRMVITDDGIGFDYQKAMDSSERQHWGLLTMQERAFAIGGEFKVETNANLGTKIEILAPLFPEPL